MYVCGEIRRAIRIRSWIFLNGGGNPSQDCVVAGPDRRPEPSLPSHRASAAVVHFCLVEVVLVDVVIVVAVVVIVVVIAAVVDVAHDVGGCVGRDEHKAEEVGHGEAIPGVHVSRRVHPSFDGNGEVSSIQEQLQCTAC